MTTWAEQELADLRHHWGSAYLITRPGPDVWVAQRRDTRETLRADTPLGLRDKILANYMARKVSRDVAP
jgi:hypothetical protein